MVNSKKTIIFQGSGGGQTFSRGGLTFSRGGGGPVAYSLKKPILLVIFQGGGGPDHLSPLWIHTWLTSNSIHFFLFSVASRPSDVNSIIHCLSEANLLQPLILIGQ